MFMNLTQAKYIDDNHKAFVKFCNSLRCPLCGMQLDGNVSAKKADLYCVNNNDEYKCQWYPGDDEPATEHIQYWYSEYEYIIKASKQSSGVYKTVINRYNLNVIPIFRHSTCKEVFNYSGSRIMIFRKRMEEEVFLKKLKTYTVFS